MVLATLSLGILSTCPNQLNPLLLMFLTIFSYPIVSAALFVRFVLQLLASFLVGALLEHSMCLNIYFLSYSLLLALVIYYPSVRFSIIEHV